MVPYVLESWDTEWDAAWMTTSLIVDSRMTIILSAIVGGVKGSTFSSATLDNPSKLLGEAPIALVNKASSYGF